MRATNNRIAEAECIENFRCGGKKRDDALSASLPSRGSRLKFKVRRVRLKPGEVGKDEAVAMDNFTGLYRDWSRKHRAGTDKSVKFSIFATRIHRGRQVGQELRIESAACETGIEFLRIDARNIGAEAISNHFAREKLGIAASKREYRDHVAFREIFFTILADILQEKIAEDDVRHTFSASLRQGSSHGVLVDFVGTRRGDGSFHEM